MRKKTPKKKIFLIILLSAVALLAVGWGVLSVIVYNENFNQRFESYEPLMLRVEDFTGLERTAYDFASDRGQTLRGYMYRWGDEQRGIIVIAHGFGAGHNAYMDCADFFARRGFYVFAYDATGNDESEGAGVGGVPQGPADLDHAISFVENSGYFPDLPIALFGHSWGGYSVCSVLAWHPEVKAVIACSGCNASVDLFEAGGKQQAGDVIYTMTPYIRLYERIRYGKYAAGTAMDGFAASGAAVLIVHSADDGVVPIEYGLDLFYETYRNDPRFTFMRYEDKGHNDIFRDTAYLDELNAGFAEWLKTLAYDFAAAENEERFRTEKAAYIHDHLDRARWSHMLDAEMFDAFLEFYEAHVTDL